MFSGAEAANDVAWQESAGAPHARTAIPRHAPVTIWLTGLSGSGKSTIASELKKRLVELGRGCYVLDGDDVRQGLCRDLGFSPEDRRENVRRVAEVSRMFNDAGLLVVTAFISPYRHNRETARDIIGKDRFIEAFLSTELAVCERRDPKGLYAKARAGKLADFTGVSAPYEAPLEPQVTLDTATEGVDECVERLLGALSVRLCR